MVVLFNQAPSTGLILSRGDRHDVFLTVLHLDVLTAILGETSHDPRFEALLRNFESRRRYRATAAYSSRPLNPPSLGNGKREVWEPGEVDQPAQIEGVGPVQS
jgi:hypothetical protein